MRCRLRDVINCFRQLCVPYIQWRSMDPTADIPPRILSESNLPLPLLLYKALRKLFLPFFFTHIQELQRTSAPSLHKRSRPLNFRSHFREKFFPKKISESFGDYCTDTRKFSFLFITPFSSRPSFLARQFVQMGKFKRLVDTPAVMEAFRARYCIPQGVVWSIVLRNEY